MHTAGSCWVPVFETSLKLLVPFRGLYSPAIHLKILKFGVYRFLFWDLRLDLTLQGAAGPVVSRGRRTERQGYKRSVALVPNSDL